jgi:predicted DCC family thiol-disulfide oxidoreductase YuxK
MKNTLYYDGKCPLCAKEIYWLNKLKNNQLELVDLWGADIEVTQNEMLKILHLRTPTGEWKKGLDANVTAWGHTPIGFLFKPLRWPLIRQVADTLYYKWANNRFCKIELKQKK